MHPEYSISLVIPAYNEEELIEETLRISNNYLQGITKNYEIIVIDDGSSDKTGKIIDTYSAAHAKVKPIHNNSNEGSGRSLFIGLKKAKYDFIVTNFADLPFDLKELEKVLTLFYDSDIGFVVICRQDRKANSLYRKITSLVNYWLIRILFNINIKDFQFVQIYRKSVLDVIDVESNGTFVPPEIIIKALSHGFKMKEYTTRFYPRRAGYSKCGNIRIVMETFFEMVRFWLCWSILHKKVESD